MINYFERLAIEPTLNYEAIKEATHKRKRLITANEEQAQQIREASAYLKNAEQRYEHYFSVKGKHSYDLSRLSALIKDNNVEEIKAIVWMLKKTKGRRWDDGDKYVVGGVVRDAIEQGNEDLVRFFLNEGVSASSWAYTEGSTGGMHQLIHFAASKGNLALVQMLVEEGADISRRDRYHDRGNDTAIIAAVEGGHPDVVEYLLSEGAGADAHTTSDEYVRAGDFSYKPLLFVAAEHQDNKRIIASMAKYGAQVGSAVSVAALVYKNALKKYQGLLDNRYSIKNRPENIYHVKEFDQERTNLISRVEYLQKNYPRMIAALLEHSIGQDLSRGPWSKDNLGIFKDLDVSGFNFIGVSIQGKPVTREMLREAGLKGWDKALVTLNDLYKLNDTEPQRMMELLDRVETSIHKNGNCMEGSGIINLVSLWQSAQLGNLNAVNARLAAGINPNEKSPENELPIVLAAEHGHLDVVKALIQAKGIDKKSIVTAIEAAKVAKHAAVEAYLSENQDVDNEDEDGNTLLHKAAASGDVERVMKLIAQGATLDKTNDNGETALGRAAKNSRYKYEKSSNPKQLEVMRILLQQGANANIYRYKSPLYAAVDVGSVEAVAMLLPVIDKKDKVTSNYRDEQLVFPWYTDLLFSALKHKESKALLELLQQHGADLNCKSKFGSTLLGCAVQNLPSASAISRAMFGVRMSIRGAEDRVPQSTLDNALNQLMQISSDSFKATFADILFLLEHGADVSLADKDGNTPLHLLIAEKDLSHLNGVYEEVLQLFLNKGAHIDAVNQKGETPLHAAARTGDIPAIKFLLLHGADINGSDGEKRTALHLAAAHGHVYTCELLVKMGANKNALDTKGLTPSALSEQSQMQDKKRYTFNSSSAEREFEQKYIDARMKIQTTTAETKAVSELVRQRQSLHAAAALQERNNPVVPEQMEEEPNSICYV